LRIGIMINSSVPHLFALAMRFHTHYGYDKHMTIRIVSLQRSYASSLLIIIHRNCIWLRSENTKCINIHCERCSNC